MFGKVMFVAGVGLVFAAAVTVVKSVKEEQRETVCEMDNGDTVEQKTDFRTAAKKKVDKIYRGFLRWSAIHMKDIQVWTAWLGLGAGIIGVKNAIQSGRATTQATKAMNDMVATFDDMQNDIKDIKQTLNRVDDNSACGCGLAGQNTLFASTVFEYLNANDKITPDIVNAGTQRTLDTIDMVRRDMQCQTK